MSWLQNTIAIVVSFLIARILIDADIHRVFVRRLLAHSQGSFSYFISGILLTSYVFSLFFSNTIVVLCMIPIIKLILEGMEDTAFRQKISTVIVLALIYGANIGGMGSLIGSPLNILYIGIIESNKLPGRENITFFSWLLFGIPASLVILGISRLVLKLGERGLRFNNPVTVAGETIPHRTVRKYVLFFLVNILGLVMLTALQFWLRPGAVIWGLNPIDLSLVFYLPLFLFFAFIYPRGPKTLPRALKNLTFMLLFVLFLIPVYVLETLRDVGLRFRLRGVIWVGRMDQGLLNLFNRVWFFLFKEKRKSLRAKNTMCFVSLNRLVYDLPFFGLLFMGAVLLVVFFLVTWGDNPGTEALDGYITVFLEQLALRLVPSGNQSFLFLLAVVMMAIFFTEIVNNTVVVVMLFPLVLTISAQLPLNPLFTLLAVTTAASGAFMTPIATSVNAIAFAGFKGVSLKRMLSLGALLNILSGLFAAVLFYCLGSYFK